LSFELELFNSSLIQKQAISEVLKMNEETAKYGLILTEQQAVALVKTRSDSLKNTGRIEFSGGVIDKLILAFCDSPYITQQNYEDTLHELVDIFYSFKNETLDMISDNDLIAFMQKSFNGTCCGSLELLSGRELPELARKLNCIHMKDFKEELDDEY
jgi:hypothetical protein